jgi:hypothetical protein
MPSCSRLSRSGLEALRQTAPLAYRPSLTAALDATASEMCRAGTERCLAAKPKDYPKEEDRMRSDQIP